MHISHVHILLCVLVSLNHHMPIHTYIHAYIHTHMAVNDGVLKNRILRNARVEENTAPKKDWLVLTSCPNILNLLVDDVKSRNNEKRLACFDLEKIL